MKLDKIKPQANDTDYNVIIEIPMDDMSPVKYEFDKDLGAMVVDRFMQVSMRYPCNYGFIPATLSDDGDPVDVLVFSNYPVISGALIKARPVGVLIMEDESGMDEKIIAVPADKLDASFKNIDSIDDLNNRHPLLKEKIEHFFEYYKKLDQGKWVKIISWDDKNKALELINDAITRFA